MRLVSQERPRVGTRWIAALLVFCVLPLASATAVAKPRDRADLLISRGKVKASGGELDGSFTVRNAGAARSKRSITLLSLAVPGKDLRIEPYATPRLAPGATVDAKVEVPIPGGAPEGTWPIALCADSRGQVDESKEGNNCADVGKLEVGGGSSFPSDPIDYKTAKPFQLRSSASRYWTYIPKTYDSSHQTPTALFVWSHGCGGDSDGDIYNVSPGGAQDWISVSLGGRDGRCWRPGADQAKVMKAIADIKTHFNIAPRSVILGGYSSGGDLSYRTAFEHSRRIAGVLAENTSPFRDTGLGKSKALGMAKSKFHVVHLAHLQDETYKIAGVREETDAMAAAGFPITRIELPGTHYDNPGAIVDGQAVPGTDADVRTYLLPHLDDGWESPG